MVSRPLLYSATAPRPRRHIAGDNDSDQFAVPVVSEGTQKTVITSGHPWALISALDGTLRQDMQITLFRDDEHTVGLNE